MPNLSAPSPAPDTPASAPALAPSPVAESSATLVAPAAATPPATSFLRGLGALVRDDAVPFFKVSGRDQRVRLLAVTIPEGGSERKRLPPKEDGVEGDLVTLLATFDVELDGAPALWEVTSNRLLAAIDHVLTNLPADLLVSSRGSGKAIGYSVKLAPDESPAEFRARKETAKATEWVSKPGQTAQVIADPETPAPALLGPSGLCDAPGCALAMGHVGMHKTIAMLLKERPGGATSPTVLAPHVPVGAA